MEPSQPAACAFEKLTQELLRFRDARDWEQFHNAKDLAIALNIEAAELLEAFLWKEPEDASREKIREELADVFCYALLLAHKAGLNPEQIIREKILKNGTKYPVEKARGKATKYNKL